MEAIRYFAWCLLHRNLRWAEEYHAVQKALYGWGYLIGRREYRADGEQVARKVLLGLHKRAPRRGLLAIWRTSAPRRWLHTLLGRRPVRRLDTFDEITAPRYEVKWG